jgi:hypothetical protein
VLVPVIFSDRITVQPAAVSGGMLDGKILIGGADACISINIAILP